MFLCSIDRPAYVRAVYKPPPAIPCRCLLSSWCRVQLNQRHFCAPLYYCAKCEFYAIIHCYIAQIQARILCILYNPAVFMLQALICSLVAYISSAICMPVCYSSGFSISGSSSTALCFSAICWAVCCGMPCCGATCTGAVSTMP